jgi:hypothetical protein
MDIGHDIDAVLSLVHTYILVSLLGMLLLFYVTASRFLAIAKHRLAPLDGELEASSLLHFYVTASRFLAIAKHAESKQSPP